MRDWHYEEFLAAWTEASKTGIIPCTKDKTPLCDAQCRTCRFLGSKTPTWTYYPCDVYHNFLIGRIQKQKSGYYYPDESDIDYARTVAKIIHNWPTH